MRLVDLHVHTANSDGFDTPDAVVKMAADNGVAVIAVTDHDNLRGLSAALEAGKRLGVTVISGVEISCIFHDHTVHLLGLGIPLANNEFHSFLGELFVYRKQSIIQKMEMISASFSAVGAKAVDMDDFIKEQGSYFNREKAARYLVVKGFMADQVIAFKALAETKIGLECPATAARAIVAIHSAGGIAILAHPFANGTSLKKIDPTPEGQEKLLQEMIGLGVDGIECYQSEHGPEETTFALSLAEKYKILVSAGSDWHGALCDVGWEIKDQKANYPDHIGGLGITTDKVAPLLERLGVSVDKT